jgi:hypothetical protein
VLREKRARGKEKWLKTWWKLEPRPSSRTGSSHGCSTHIPPPSKKPNLTSWHATFLERGVIRVYEKVDKTKNLGERGA